MNHRKVIKCQALSSSADIVIGGGAAGVGKTFTLLLDPLRHIHIKDFGGVIFRRTSPQIKAQGGLWDTSLSLYSLIPGAEPKETNSSWSFSNTSKLKFNHLEYEKNVFDWQGSQIPFIGFDEFNAIFSETMFFLFAFHVIGRFVVFVLMFVQLATLTRIHGFLILFHGGLIKKRVFLFLNVPEFFDTS